MSVKAKISKKDLQTVEASPFLKWAGGKRSLISQITPNIPKEFSCYYEPFLGGGAVFFSLIRCRCHSYLSDKNPLLILTYKVIQEYPEKLIKLLENHQNQHSTVYYKNVRTAFNCKEPSKDSIEVAARFIYLNRTCFNGLYRVNGSGDFNVPMGKYENPKICDKKNLFLVNQVLKNTTVFFSDFRKIDPQKNDFIYCDPPYHGTFGDYTASGFTDDDQKDLKNCVDIWVKKGVKVMISQSDTEFIRHLYRKYKILEVSCTRLISCQADARGSISELLILTY